MESLRLTIAFADVAGFDLLDVASRKFFGLKDERTLYCFYRVCGRLDGPNALCQKAPGFLVFRRMKVVPVWRRRRFVTVLGVANCPCKCGGRDCFLGREVLVRSGRFGRSCAVDCCHVRFAGRAQGKFVGALENGKFRSDRS